MILGTDHDRKRDLRARLSHQRLALTESQIAEAGVAIAGQLARILVHHRIIATFMPFKGEPAFALALHQRLPRHELAYPVCSQNHRDLTFRIADAPPTRVVQWGIGEPDPSAPVVAYALMHCG
jgi:5-formyltetrahydrofolate cyclo-ligase